MSSIRATISLTVAVASGRCAERSGRLPQQCPPTDVQLHLDASVIIVDCAVGPVDQAGCFHAVEELGGAAAGETHHVGDRARPHGSVEVEEAQHQNRCIVTKSTERWGPARMVQREAMKSTERFDRSGQQCRRGRLIEPGCSVLG